MFNGNVVSYPIVEIRPSTPTNSSHIQKERQRFPRQVGLSFSQCQRICGWKAFEEYTCKPGTLIGVSYRLTVVRQFFRYARDHKASLSFKLFFDIEMVDKFLLLIISDPLAKAKTKINKLWALRFVMGWLIICVKRGETDIVGSNEAGLLEGYVAMISSHVSHLHQQAKIDYTLVNRKEVLQSRNVYLSIQEFRQLGINLVSRLNELQLAIDSYDINRRENVSEYRRCLFTAFFVLIPVQRLRVIFDLRWIDITLYGESKGGCIQVGIEKTSYSKLGRGETIGRSLFVPEVLCKLVRYWRTVNSHCLDHDYVFSANGRYLVSSEASRMVTMTTEKLAGKHVTAQTLRKLRITHVLDAVKGDDIDIDRVVGR